MTDLALTTSPIPEPHTWLSVGQYASLTGQSVGHVRRRASTEFLFAGKARKLNGDWQIRDDADPQTHALAVSTPAPVIEITAKAFLDCSPAARTLAMQKADIVKRWQAVQAAGMSVQAATAWIIAQLEKEKSPLQPTRATLYNWQRDCAEGGGIESLIDGRQRRKADQDAARSADPFFAALKDVWATQNQLGLPVCHKITSYLAKQHGWPLQTLSAYAALEIKHTHALPLHPQSKPVERFFRTVCDRFSRLWATYCGNSPENRPDGVEKRRDAGEGPDLAEFIKAFGAWVEDDYNHRPHTGQGMDGKTPAEVWEANLKVKRTCPREVLEVLMQPRFKAKVDQRGVRVNHLTYGKFALNAWIGQEVFVRTNLADISMVSVWTARDEFLCFAPCNSPLPMNAATPPTIEMVRAAQRQIAEFTKKQKAAWEAQSSGLHLAGSDIPTLMLAAAAEQAQAARTLPQGADGATMKLVRGDIEAHTKALQAAQEEQSPAPALPPGLSIDAALDAYQTDEE